MKKTVKLMVLTLLSIACSGKITADVGTVTLTTQTIGLTESNLKGISGTWSTKADNTKAAVIRFINMQAGMYAKFTLYFDNNTSQKYELAPYQSINFLWNTRNCIKKIRVDYGQRRGLYSRYTMTGNLNFCARKYGDKYYIYGVVFGGYRITANRDWPR